MASYLCKQILAGVTSATAITLSGMMGSNPVRAATMIPGVSLTGDITATTVNAGDSVAHNQLQSNREMFLFAEQQNVTLSSALNVDHLVTGSAQLDRNNLGNPGIIAAGTTVDSFMFHVDPQSGAPTISGTATFQDEIMGVIFNNGQPETTTPVTLLNSDPIVGLDGVVYEQNFGRRFLQGEDVDFLQISEDGKSLTITMWVSYLDELRVITKSTSVPEPTSLLAIFAVGTLGLVAAKKKNKPR